MSQISEELSLEGIQYCAQTLGISPQSVAKTCQLLFKDNSTIPFIARYRKEVTGNLDEVKIRDIQLNYEEYLEKENRRSYILDTLEKQKMLTPELKAQILKAQTLNQLEDIYSPFKSKRKTKAMQAKELGLMPLAMSILEGQKNCIEDSTLMQLYVTPSNGGIESAQSALDGARDILVELFSHQLDVKEKIRSYYWSQGIITSVLRPKVQLDKESEKFKDFFNFSEQISKIKDAKNSHRFMAIRRGMNQKILKVDIQADEKPAILMIQDFFFSKANQHPYFDFLIDCAQRAFNTYIHPSLDLELKNELKKIADIQAISIFSINLKNLLLQPYLGTKAVIGIDPGIRTGCKVVIIDETGKLLGDFVIYPFEPQRKIAEAKNFLEKSIDHFKIKYIAIGNGTNGRETLSFLQDNIDQVKSGQTSATLISEAGASIYSASDIAREEFPDKDITVRGAVSIARRFQDPLSELVKIDPKSIGVGQYQHDVNQIQLKRSLEGIVETCVNYVGVDLNTASASILSYISGITPAVAQSIITYRQKKGMFKSREELQRLPRFSAKIFEQAAGFLRIYNGINPLDASFIHPERYEILAQWVNNKNKKLKDLMTDDKLQKELESDPVMSKELGYLTLTDIIKSLKAPTQDPRSVFTSADFAKNIKSINDLIIDEWYTGVVSNITMFGAFVDIGIKENGLLHISEISDQFVDDPTKHLTVGQVIKVRVLSIDNQRSRIALTCKSSPTKNTVKQPSSPPKKSIPIPNEIKNNAFSGLKDLKLK